MRPINFFIIIGVCFILFSCEISAKKRIKNIVQEWHGKEIKFPDKSEFIKLDSLSPDYNFDKYQHKILVYIDSLGCTECKLKLHEWVRFIKRVDSITSNQVPFVFVFQSKNKKKISNLTNGKLLKSPILIDNLDQLDRLNHFPTNENLHTFLLDEDNYVKIIGNPIGNKKIKELFIKTLNQYY